MTKIRKLYYFDKKNAAEMVSFLDKTDYVSRIMFNPLLPLHHLLPLKLKFLPESYVLKDKKEIKGLITIAPTGSPLKQMEIQKLLFEENCYEDAGELIQYVVSKYKALGTASVIVRIDDYFPELVKLFISKCSFSQISYERLWKINEEKDDDNINNKMKNFRVFRNSDAPIISNIYNEQLLPHFRTLLNKDAKEFKDVIFKGLSYFTEYKYVYRDKHSKNITAYLSVKTSDNKNFVLDFTQTGWEQPDTDLIIRFARNVIKKRNKNYNLFVVTKKYTQSGEQYENEFRERKYECVQNHIVLTNSSARIIKNAEGEKKFIGLNQFYGGVSIMNRNRL